jgi:sirohydrochlorin ferrochelatase
MRLARHVARAMPGVTVRPACADVRGPRVSEVLPELLDLAPEVVVVPAFLAAGYHVRNDLPAQLRAIGADGRAVLTPVLGGDHGLTGAAFDRLRQAGARRGDAVVLAAAGSSDPNARAQVRQAARALGARLGTPVQVGYLAGDGPRLTEVTDRLRAADARVAVASWLLAPGYFQDRLEACGADVRARPLAGHPGVTNAVLARYRQACMTRAAVA